MFKVTGINCYHATWWKESLNSDGQQFHQYQQNKQKHEVYIMLTVCFLIHINFEKKKFTTKNKILRKNTCSKHVDI
jgi:hypothetical protein